MGFPNKKSYFIDRRIFYNRLSDYSFNGKMTNNIVDVPIVIWNFESEQKNRFVIL